MTSILKVDTIQDTDGNNIINESGNTITIGASGDTTNIIGTLQNDGAAVGGANTPAFQATLSSSQSISNSSATKVQFDSEIFDSDGTFDSSSNYRFTPAVAGKYHVTAKVNYADASADDKYEDVLLRRQLPLSPLPEHLEDRHISLISVLQLDAFFQLVA